MLTQYEVYLIFGCLGSDDHRAEPLAAWKTGAESNNPVERSYAQQILRFVEQVQIDLCSTEARNLISQISLIEK
jgi:hypothetical protein